MARKDRSSLNEQKFLRRLEKQQRNNNSKEARYQFELDKSSFSKEPDLPAFSLSLILTLFIASFSPDSTGKISAVNSRASVCQEWFCLFLLMGGSEEKGKNATRSKGYLNIGENGGQRFFIQPPTDSVQECALVPALNS